MRLEDKLIELIKNTAKQDTGTDTTGKVLRVENGVAWVHIDGGAEETPVYETIACSAGDVVNVRISKGTAFLVGNGTAPPTDDTEAIIASIKAATAQKTADEAKYMANLSVGILEANKLTAQTAIIQDLLSAKKAIVQTATITDLTGATADFNQVVTDMVDAGKITADQAVIIKANFTTAIGESLTVGEVDAKKAVFANLTSDVVEANILSSLVAEFDRASVDWLHVKRLDADYANINGANIHEAFIGQVFNKNAMIEDAIVTTLDATGQIIAVRINADYINANTLKANRIIFLGTDGLFHQLNESGETSLPDQSDENSLNGSVITASSITADKLTVTDLSAFGADIAGLKLEDSSIHTYGKDSPYSTVAGWYIGTADGGGGIEDNNGDILLSNDGRDFDTRSDLFNGFAIGNGTEYMRFAGGVLQIKSNNLDENFLKRSEYLAQTKYTFGRRMSGTTVANWSVEEGQDNEASGLSSHAEGTFTKASGDMSHSEGFRTEASGIGAHVEGNWSVASGAYSHAEGIDSDAIGDYSHAEGYFTEANGDYAHSEGRSTRASGTASHASGGYTAAESDFQTVMGKHNVSDSNNQYALIIGGGNGAYVYDQYVPFSSVSWTNKNLIGAKIKFASDEEGYPIGIGGDWIFKSNQGVVKTLYQVYPYEEPAGSEFHPPAYRYGPDDTEVYPPSEGEYDPYELVGARTASSYEEVIWNPTKDFIVSQVNTSHPLYQNLMVALPLQYEKRNILAVDWNGNIHIPSTASVIADL